MNFHAPPPPVIGKVSAFRRSLVENHPLARIRQFLFGSPLKTAHQQKEKVGFWLGFPILALDTISSLAYATEEMLIALALGGVGLLQLSMPVVLAIILLLWILVISYYQTVEAYPEGGGAYIVAKQNISPFASILAASTLILDYILTVAVSVSAGIRAVTSAYPHLFPRAVELSVAGILILGWLNLRGIRESARVTFVPVYGFILMVFIVGLAGILALPPEVKPIQFTYTEDDILWSVLSIFIIVRAFAGGCTAMTGIEAVANIGGVLKAPINRISQKILISIGLIGTIGFFLITKGSHHLGLIPQNADSILSQLARATFGHGWFYTTFQLLTALILFLAANTSFAGFPQLTAMVAKDQWLPKQLGAMGDRLVFSYGIIWLSLISCVLVILFDAHTHTLIPIYAIGVFSVFTLNQIGMTHFWFKVHQKNKLAKSHGISVKKLFSHPLIKMFINIFGAFCMAIALLVISATKFIAGGFVVFLAVPLIVRCCYGIRNHYLRVEKELRITEKFKKQTTPRQFSQGSNRVVVVPVFRLHRGSYQALAFAREISQNVIVPIVNIDRERAESTQKLLEELNWGLKTIVLESPYRSIIQPLVEYVLYLDKVKDQLITLILPEIIPAKWWQNFLHNSTANAIAKHLSWSEHIPNQARIIINVPFHVKS